jgi:glycosidase
MSEKPEEENTEISFSEISWDGTKRADVFYEIFVRSFADSNGDGIGDLDGVTASLEYLHSLGVSGIWLMPINPSPTYHGYDVTNYVDINPQYGTLADFDELLAKAHSLDIKVIVDFVMNHSSNRHPWFLSARQSADSPYRNYYIIRDDGSYVANFATSMPDLNYGTVATLETMPVWDAICSAAEFWLERGTDGFRLDAVKHLYDSQYAYDNAQLLAKFRERMMLTTPDVYIIGEAWTGTAEEMAPYYGGLQAFFDFPGWDRLLWALNNDSGKWYPKDMLEHEAAFSAVRPDYIHATKLSNHDEERTASALGRDEDKMKMAAKVLLTISGSPYIYYGEELGMTGLKSNGDEGLRSPFPWGEAAPEGTKQTSWRKTDESVKTLASQKADPSSLWNVYRQFSELRNADPVMAYGEMTLPEGYNAESQSGKQIMAFYREYEGTRYLVLHNLSANQTSYNISGEVKRGVVEHGGGIVKKSGSAQYTATLPPYASVICEL